jgi:hypothetical protein
MCQKAVNPVFIGFCSFFKSLGFFNLCLHQGGNVRQSVINKYQAAANPVFFGIGIDKGHDLILAKTGGFCLFKGGHFGQPSSNMPPDYELACEGWPVNDGTAMEPGEFATAWEVA